MELLLPSKWVWVDYTITGILLFSAVIGLFRGFMKEAFGLLTWVVAVSVATHYCQEFSALLQNSITSPVARIALAFIGLFFATLILGRLISFLLSQLLEKIGLTIGDRLLGMGFGMIKGAVLVAILVMLAGLSPIPGDPWWKQSQLIPPFQSLAVWLKDHVPSKLSDYIKYR